MVREMKFTNSKRENKNSRRELSITRGEPFQYHPRIYTQDHDFHSIPPGVILYTYSTHRSPINIILLTHSVSST